MTALPAITHLCIARILLPADLVAVSPAREFVRHAFHRWNLSDCSDDAELVVSELVANAAKIAALSAAESGRTAASAGHVVGVQLRFGLSELHVEVWDRGDGTPAIPEQTPEAESGRGLFLVESVSNRWGSRAYAGGGKVTWADLPLPNQASSLGEGSASEHGQGNHRHVEDEEAVQLMEAAFAQHVLEGLGHPVKAGAPAGPRRRHRTRPSRLNQEPAAIARARERAGMTKRALARAVGVSEQLVGEIESGWRNATLSNLEKMAVVLDCPAALLLRRPSTGAFVSPCAGGDGP